MTLRFLRNKVVEVSPQADGRLAVSWRLTDDLLMAEVDICVQLPDLEIVEARAELKRLVPRAWSQAGELIQKIEGVRIGAGLRKIVQGLLGGTQGCPLLVHAVLESANAVILHFTRPVLENLEMLEGDERLAGLREMIKNNPRLVRSCVAFQDDSPIMQNVDSG
ncbi:MAG: DUF2889 domain-containing protein [Deltaproteobacteria bacterium]|jgi:hypothetical protein|nr:DUF2889 domain-containing protein [Deltaproteobacteria bacterium]MBW2482639.1 DUF2889 domain-containing protein [Deltaproteobacteria bacterium]